MSSFHSSWLHTFWKSPWGSRDSSTDPWHWTERTRTASELSSRPEEVIHYPYLASNPCAPSSTWNPSNCSVFHTRKSHIEQLYKLSHMVWGSGQISLFYFLYCHPIVLMDLREVQVWRASLNTCLLLSPYLRVYVSGRQKSHWKPSLNDWKRTNGSI